MSKKLTSPRLDSLFAGFEDQEPCLPIETVEAPHCWTWSVGLDGKYIQCSPEVIDSLGFKPESFIDRSLFTYAISPESSGSLRATIQDQIFPTEIEIKFVSKSGELITVRTNIFQSVSDDGSAAGWHGVNLEIGREQIFPEFKSDKHLSPKGQLNRSPVDKISIQTAGKKVVSSGTPATTSPMSPIGPKEHILSSKSISTPIQVGGKTEALIELVGDSDERKFSEDDRLLVEEVARQLSLALENARLYEDIRKAMAALETRERYQANIARAVAILSQSGTAALPKFLDALGQATRCGKITIAEHQAANPGHWMPVAEWNNPDFTVRLKPSRWEIEASAFPNWRKQLIENGWAGGTISDSPVPEKDFLKEKYLGSSLLLAVVHSGSSEPGFIAFDQVDSSQLFKKEEIGLLRVAADAFSNTIARQNLLGELQFSLKETETLYNTSHKLALATDVTDMVSIIMTEMHSPLFNRAILILFDLDSQGKPGRLTVRANWYSGAGTPPPSAGFEWPSEAYFPLLQSTAPHFYDDILNTDFDPSMQEFLVKQSAHSAAILPLWANKKQTGVFILLSDDVHPLLSGEMRGLPPLVDQMATAIENMSLFIRTQEALSETALLYQVTNRIAQATDKSELVRLVTQKMLPRNAEAASILLANYSAENRLTDLELAGFALAEGGHYQPANEKIPVAALPFISRLTQDLEIIPDVLHSQLDPVSQKTFEKLNILAACIVPLRSAGRMIGLLMATAHQATEFDLDEARLLQVAGSGIAVALERQRLLTEAQRRALELQTAAEIARDTTSTLSLDTLLERIVTLLSGQFNYYHAAIYLLDEHARYAVVREANGAAGQVMKKQGYRLAVGSRTAIGTATTSGKPTIINDISISPFNAANPLLPETRSQMVLPLKLGERIIGALDIQSNELNAFNPDDVSVLQILADQIAVAIENARSYELSQKALADIQEVDRLKSQFLANMSHELRTPLNSIIGFSRVILKGIDGPINETQKQDLGAIYNSGQHLLALITDILDLSKIEAGKMDLQFTDVNLADLINSAMSTAVGLVKDKPITLFHSVPPEIPVIRADSTRVRQVLINFISNAAKFTEKGTITVEASMVAGPQSQEAMVTVADTGIGISVEDQAKLFQPFSQVDDSPTRKSGGTGLGLSISRSLIELHGGRIGLLRSEVGKGSTFFFTLPIRKDKTGSLPTTNPLDKVVLSIDDDPQVVSLYERYLKSSGFRVVPLSNPKEAVEYARQLKPYAITLDVMMPEKDGWQVLQELKNNPETRRIPIIVCSILEEEEKGFNLGAAEYLIKPFLQEELINTLNRLNAEGKISKILVIDDDAEALRLVEKILVENGKFQVTLAYGGKNGWEQILKNTPDAVILDLFMPEMDGFTLLDKLRDSPEAKNIPVVVLTGADLTEEQYAKLSNFGQQLLDKGTLNEKDLLATLHKTLSSIKN